MTQEHQEYIYTINSTDKDHYTRISANLDIYNMEYSVFQVTELTARCSILVLTSQDYFTINSKQYFFETDYTDLNNETFVTFVDDLVASDGYYCELDSAYRVHFFAVNEFEVGDMSYLCKLLFGLHGIKLLIESKYNDNLKPIEITNVNDEGEDQFSA